MNETSKKKEKLKLPDGISLPEIEVSEATIRETIVDDNGKTYEVEKKIEFPVIKQEKNRNEHKCTYWNQQRKE